MAASRTRSRKHWLLPLALLLVAAVASAGMVMALGGGGLLGWEFWVRR